jgi:nitrogenase iron protein NifH
MGKVGKFVIYGKGGIGKSMLAGNLAMVYARRNLKVLQVGCDPKHDSTAHLLGPGKKITTVMDVVSRKDPRRVSKNDIVFTGINNIDCIECGGPKPGVGCAGRGISLMFEIMSDLALIERGKYDVVIFDVLGDVVCGGFAAPLKLNFAEKVFIVISEEPASMYAANNISQAVNHYAYNGIYLGGLILNLRDNDSAKKYPYEFAKRLNSRILAEIPRSKKVCEAEYRNKTAVEAYPGSDIAKIFSALADKVLSSGKGSGKAPKFMDEEVLAGFFAK